VKPTPQQREVWRVLAQEQCHVIVEALAGSGKTTTIVEGAKKLPRGQTVAFVAFNRGIADELATKLPKTVVSSTLNSLGNKAVYRAYGKTTIDRDRTVTYLPFNMDRQTKRAIAKLVSLCKGNLLDGRNLAELDALCISHNIELNGTRDIVFEWVPNILEQSKEVKGVIDFDDQVWLPVVNNLAMRKFDVLMVDESQDLNRAQQELVMRAGERIVLVGDRHQAIYGFRGADAASMQRMEQRLSRTPRGCKVLPLTVTFRCSISVVVLAKRIVAGLRARDDAPVGAILRGEEAAATKIEVGHMVLCRVNAPLISMAYGFIKNQTPVKVQGRDIGEGLQNLILRWCHERDSVIDLTRKAEEYRAVETTRIMADETHLLSNETKLMVLNDRCDCILALCEGMDLVQDVIIRIDALFANLTKAETSRFVLLSSVHRAKGLESDIVHIIHEELLPHPMARQDWEMEQEKNLKYVAFTRAKETLVFR
jgi:DNA helicase-2/ATP-dependent DNA helicase PcrA